MSTTLEKTITLDRKLVQRADRKLRRYGRSLTDVVTYILNEIVSTRGDPMKKEESLSKLLLESFKEAELIEQGALPAKGYANAEDLISDCLK